MSPIDVKHKTVEAKALDVSLLKGVALDSRSVKRGYLFAALPGSKQDGHKFIGDAILNGANYILADAGTVLPKNSEHVTLVTADNSRKAFSELAARFYKGQPENIVAVTGTNGKTSTVHFINQFWKALDLKSAGLGTLGLSVQGGAYTGGRMTTPDPVSLHAELADLAAVKINHLAMEASSHGLDQYRLDGVKVKVAAFTNLTRDHLDYHKDMEAYLTAKMRLFADVLLPEGVAVLNADIPEFKSLQALCKKSGRKVLSYGNKGKDFKIVQIISLPHGQGMDLDIMGKRYHVILPLVGGFQSMNALCALACVVAEDPKNTERTASLVKVLEKLKGVPGRLQLVPGRSDYAVYVDYAHTPDALSTVLEALKKHTKGRLCVVFGCGGNRDQGKRQVMGSIAAKLADMVIVTDDNPRSELPAEIRAHIMDGARQGAKELHEIEDRRKAIGFAMEQMKSGDVLLVAGKGHEQGQIFSAHCEPFDDVNEVETAMRRVT